MTNLRRGLMSDGFTTERMRELAECLGGKWCDAPGDAIEALEWAADEIDRLRATPRLEPWHGTDAGW